MQRYGMENLHAIAIRCRDIFDLQQCIRLIAGFGLFSWTPAIAGLLLSVPYMLFNWAGGRLFARRPDRDFRAVAYVIIAASALLGLPIWS